MLVMTMLFKTIPGQDILQLSNDKTYSDTLTRTQSDSVIVVSEMDILKLSDEEIFLPGTSLDNIVGWVRDNVSLHC